MNTMKKCSTCGSLFSGDLCSKCMAGFAQKSTEPTAPPEDLPLKTGQSFHGLEILELLGRGGMGVVYKARQPALDRMVALKILPLKLALDPDFQNRFIREAKALGSLSHPNIVAVYDFGAEGGFFFFAMEFIDGTNLRQILRDRKLTPEQGLKIVPQICDALEYAHGEGVVHRDIKPENILLDKRGRVKIADFGLAKLVGADAPVNLTMTNMVMGTPHYMAPEQVENPKSVDHRADIYAIGVVLYEMLTGELPIGRFEMPSKMVKIDVRLDEVVLKALEKSPDRRYQNAGDIKDAVTKATTVGTSAESYMPTVITPKPAKKSANRPMIAMGVVTAAAVLLAGVALLKSPPAATPPAIVPPTPPAVVKVDAPVEAVDLTKLYFSPEERPGGFVYQQTGTEFPRNPMPVKDPADIDILIKNLDGVGLQNIDRSEIKQGYVAAWWRWSVAFAAIETPAAERIEKTFLGLEPLKHKWTHRKGPLLVLAWAIHPQNRYAFAQLVEMLQKKLGLPALVPDVPLDSLTVEKGELPEDWMIESLNPSVLSKTGLVAGSEQSMYHADQKGGIVVVAALYDTAARAKTEEASILQAIRKDATRTESCVAGRTILAMALRGRQIGAYEKVAGKLRICMGTDDYTFDSVVPVEAELPDGYRFDSVETDVRAILKQIPIKGVQASEVRRAWRAVLKPHGSIVIFQPADSTHRSAFNDALSKRGAGTDGHGLCWGVEAPDDESLDAIENFVREKFGWDRNHPRPLQLMSARLQPSDLPAGFEIVDEAIDRRNYACTIKGKDVSLACKFQQTFDYGLVEKLRREQPSHPGDIVLIKDTVLAWVSGPESAWPVLEALEPVLRRKMRLGPPSVEDFALRTADLPKGSLYLDRAPVLSPNPRLGRSTSSEVKGWWEAMVDPSETKIDVYELKEETMATAWGTLLEETRKKQGRNPAHFRILRRGPFVVVLEQQKAGEAAFKALADSVRGKLRQPGP